MVKLCKTGRRKELMMLGQNIYLNGGESRSKLSGLPKALPGRISIDSMARSWWEDIHPDFALTQARILVISDE